MRTALANTLVIVASTMLHNFALIHREQDFDEDIENEDVQFDIVAQQTQVGMSNAYASSLFYDTLLNKINELIKLRVRFIEKKKEKKGSIHRNLFIFSFFCFEILLF